MASGTYCIFPDDYMRKPIWRMYLSRKNNKPYFQVLFTSSSHLHEADASKLSSGVGVLGVNWALDNAQSHFVLLQIHF